MPTPSMGILQWRAHGKACPRREHLLQQQQQAPSGLGQAPAPGVHILWAKQSQERLSNSVAQLSTLIIGEQKWEELL